MIDGKERVYAEILKRKRIWVEVMEDGRKES